jgi:transcriptional regulator with XRE-family HTH domain
MPTISQLRNRKFLTQKQISEHIGVPLSVISSWERGIYEPRLADLQRLCKTLEISIHDIDFPDTSPLIGVRREYEALKKGDSHFLSTVRGRTAGQ